MRLGMLHDVLNYRDLLYLLIKRDIKVRYFNTILGPLWILIQPLLSAGAVSIAVSMIGQEAPSILSVTVCYVGILGWTTVAAAMQNVGSCLAANSTLTSKVWFPRIILPLSVMCKSMLDCSINLAFLILLILSFGNSIGGSVLMLVPAFALLFGFALGVGLLLSAGALCMKDIHYGLGFVMQLGIFIMPIMFKVGDVPERWRGLYANFPPVAGIELLRYTVIPGYQLTEPVNAGAVIATLSILALGILAFNRTSEIAADML